VRARHERSIELSEELGVEPLVEKMNVGVVALDSGDNETAAALFEDVLAARRRDGYEEGIGIALLNLGVARLELGDVSTAADHFEEAREVMEAIGFEGHIGYAYEGLACVADAREQFEEAARLLGCAQAHLDRAGWSTDYFVADLRAEVGDARARRSARKGSRPPTRQVDRTPDRGIRGSSRCRPPWRGG
jgi:tetratricopeptide (TPR) repeat protein